MLRNLNRRVALSIALALIVGFMASSSKALSITPVDWDGFATAGSSIAGPLTTDFFRPPPNQSQDIGDLVSEVFFNMTTMLYTYELQVTPGTSMLGVDDFHTEFAVSQLGGSAGFSFSERDAAIGNGNPISIMVDPDATLDYETLSSFGWDDGETITFFYQSFQAPIERQYGLANSLGGGATGLAPVPEPASAAVFMTGFSIVALAIRGRRTA